MNNNKENKKSNIGIYIFFIGLSIYVISYLVPTNIFNNFTHIKPIGMSTIFICPILGIIGLIFSIKSKSILFSILNLILIFSFPITMFVGYNLLGNV